MLEKLKNNFQALLAILLFIMSGAFIYERSRRKTTDAIADNKEDLDKINEMNKQISSNSGQIEAEEAKRADIKKEMNDAKSDDNSDATDFLKRR
jgi:hypothetical protein